MSDVFALQDEVARDIAKHLRLKLTKEEDSRLVRRGTTNTDAYQIGYSSAPQSRPTGRG